MPYVDKYDTQSAIELIRQSVDYRGWYDKVRQAVAEDHYMVQIGGGCFGTFMLPNGASEHHHVMTFLPTLSSCVAKLALLRGDASAKSSS